MITLTVQEKIKELSSIERISEAYLDKCQDIIKTLIDQENIYTLIDPNSTEEEIETGRGNIFYGVLRGIPTMWLFSEKEIAEGYAEFSKFKRNDIPLIKKITYEELSLSSYMAMFSGVGQVIIDEGRAFLATNIYDLVNEFLVSSGQPPILERKEYFVMNILNSIRYANTKVWIVPERGTTINDIVFNKFNPDIQNGVVNLFLNEAQSNAYSKNVGNNNGISIDLNMESLEKLVQSLLKSNVTRVRFILNNVGSEIEVDKLSMLLNKME